ncbi:MAG: Mobile element protein, partial [Olavius algarvensis Gamma 1 endosymbiont]
HLSTSLAGFRLYNQYFETFAEFKAACEEFFRNLRVSPCSGCETGHPSPPFALRSGDNLYVPRTP